MKDESLFQVGETVEFWRVLVHLSFLASCLVLFEKVLHGLEHKFPPSDKYQHMLKKVYRELMILEMISLSLKILQEIPVFISESKAMLAFELADLAILLLALALILQSTTNARAERAELITTQDLVNSVNDSKSSEDAGPSFFRTLFCCGRSAKQRSIDKELVKLRLLRRLFLRRFGLPQLFPFSKYLSRAQANEISHMIEVEPSMWVVLLAVAWTICGVLKLLEELDTAMPERQDLVEAFFMIAWILLLLHIMVLLYLRPCVHFLLRAASFSDDKSTLSSNLRTIAEEESKAWQHEEVDKALEVMNSIQEHHEEFEDQFAQDRSKQRTTFQLISSLFGCEMDIGPEYPNGIVAGSPRIDIRFFSHKLWHVLITLFVQCVLYDLDQIYETFGTLPAVLVPLQRHIFYDFVVIHNILRIDSHTLSDVVENFSEVVRLRSEFGTTLHQHLTQHELSITDLQVDLKTRDAAGSGVIDVEDLRYVLAKFGFTLTRFQFNSVVLLFELEGTTVAYVQIVRLALMAQNEELSEKTSACHQQQHPLLRPSVRVHDNIGQHNVLSELG